MESLILPFVCAAAGFLVADVLTAPGEVLAWWPGVVRRVFRLDKRSPMDWNVVQLTAYKILFGCAKCVAGQLALWASVFLHAGWGQGAANVVLAIFFAYAIQRHYAS